MIVDFQIKNKVDRYRFFKKIFLVANIKFKVMLKIFFLKISNKDILFDEKTFT